MRYSGGLVRAVKIGAMRLTEFTQLMNDEFGEAKANWLSHSHVLADLGGTPDDLIARGVNPAQVWNGLCDDFDVPEERRLGVDRPGS